MLNENSDQIHICPFCGGSSYTWGLLRAHRTSTPMDFVPGESFFARLKNLTTQEVKTRRCDDCGNIQLFAEE